MNPWTLIGVALAVGLFAGCGPSKGSYVRQNEDILGTLPEVPGARRLEATHNPYYEEDGLLNRPIGWTTNLIYRVPAGMTDRQVIDFYVDRMGEDWEARVEEIPIVDIETEQQMGIVLVVTFVQGEAVVSVNTDNMFPGGPGTFELAVDHRGRRDR